MNTLALLGSQPFQHSTASKERVLILEELKHIDDPPNTDTTMAGGTTIFWAFHFLSFSFDLLRIFDRYYVNSTVTIEMFALHSKDFTI